jgi:DNA-binding MurR/RpiR family transcriptional regulator
MNTTTPNGQSALEVRFLRATARLNGRRRRLVQAILENAEESCFLSSRELARRHRVDPSTVVRTVQALGYERFGGFSADLRAHFLRSLTPYSVLQAGASRDLTLRDRVRLSIHEDLERLRGLQSALSPDQVLAPASESA